MEIIVQHRLKEMRQSHDTLNFVYALSSVTFQLSHEIKDRLFTSLTLHYGVELRSSSENRLITDAWDSMQRSVSISAGELLNISKWIRMI